MLDETMKPAAQAAALCAERGVSFREELEAHLWHGFVFSTPEAFLMGRPVPKGAQIFDVWQTWSAAECNAWFIWLAVGTAGRLLSFMPYELPWLGWVRQGRGWRETRWVRTARLRGRLVSGGDRLSMGAAARKTK
jgi:hypothetical protein